MMNRHLCGAVRPAYQLLDENRATEVETRVHHSGIMR